MANINANGDKMVECGSDIINLANEYNSIVEALFDRLSNVTNTCWSGSSANLYANQVRVEKNQYEVVGNNLLSYGKNIRNSGEVVSSIVRKWESR